MPHHRSWAALALTFVIGARTVAHGESESWKGKVVVKDGVRHVVNSGAAMEPARVVGTSEIWRVGGEGEALFGRISDVVRDAKGSTYLLDDQLERIHVIGPNGDYVGTVGRSGEGPGEFRRVSGLALLDDTTLCVAQVVPARAVLLTVRGRGLGTHPLSSDLGMAYLNGCTSVGGRLALQVDQGVPQENSVVLTTTFVSIDERGNVATTHWARSQKVDFANMAFDEKTDASPVWAFGHDGRFYVTDEWDAYAVRVMDPEGKAEHVIEREYRHRPRASRELQSVEAMKERGDMPPDTKTSETSRDVSRLVPRSNGHLWVLSSRGEMDVPPGTVATFDEFDPSGRYVREVTVSGPFKAGQDVFLMTGDFLFILTNSADLADIAEDTEMELVCLKLALPDAE
jgi:hypothetical protein